MTNRDMAIQVLKVATQFDRDSYGKFYYAKQKIVALSVNVEEFYHEHNGDLETLKIPEAAKPIIDFIFRFGFEEARRIYAERSANLTGFFKRSKIKLEHSRKIVNPDLMLETSRYK